MKKVALFVLVACVAVATPAAADLGTVYMRHSGVTPYYSSTIYAPYVGTVSGVPAGVNHQQVADPHVATTYHGVPDWGFCIEMSYSTSGWAAYNVLELEYAPQNHGPGGSPMGATKADYIRELWAMVAPSPTMGRLEAAALQAAIWEIVYEDAQAWNVMTRNDSDPQHSFKLSMNTEAMNLANAWLGELLLPGQGPLASLVALSLPGCQDFIVQVPVPGAVLLGVLGLGAAGMRLRRFA